jgi:large subunit ribosomal protein L6
MSRIGNKSVQVPDGVTVTVSTNEVEVKGPKGVLKAPGFKSLTVTIEDNQVKVSRKNNLPQSRANHGLLRSLINNHIIGVTEGYKKTLKMIGTGYRVTSKGQGLSLTVGFSHPVEVAAEEGVKLSLEGNDTIHIEGIDKQKVGQMAANIREIKPPEPYKGKGIRYIDEVVIRKAGKTATK